MSELKIKVGDRIRIKQLPPYIKTADPMPMLRPANILTLGEEGIIVKANPGGYWSVRFSQGTYLLEPKYFQLLR